MNADALKYRNRNQDVFFEWLRNHPDVAVSVGDEEFCRQLYASLVNSQVQISLDFFESYYEDDELEELMLAKLKYGEDIFDVGYSFRGAGRVVAELRNFHIGTSEDYMDWYCCVNDTHLYPAIDLLYREADIKWGTFYEFI